MGHFFLLSLAVFPDSLSTLHPPPTPFYSPSTIVYAYVCLEVVVCQLDAAIATVY